MTIVIGVSGFPGAGKDTIGNFLVREYGFVRLSFACIVKELVASLFCWDLKMLQGDTPESREWREQVDHKWSEILEREITPRKALELMGTESCREVFGENIFSGRVKILIDEYIKEGKSVVITDCRFIKGLGDALQVIIMMVWVFFGEYPKFFHESFVSSERGS